MLDDLNRLRCELSLDPAVELVLSVFFLLVVVATVLAMVRGLGRWAVGGFRPGDLVIAMVLAPFITLRVLGRWLLLALTVPMVRRVAVLGVVLVVAGAFLIKGVEAARPEIALAAKHSCEKPKERPRVLFQVQWNTGGKYYGQKRFGRKTIWSEFYESDFRPKPARDRPGVTRAEGLSALAELTAKVQRKRPRAEIAQRTSYQRALAKARQWILAGGPPQAGQSDNSASVSFYLRDPKLPPDARIDIIPQRGQNFIS